MSDLAPIATRADDVRSRTTSVTAIKEVAAEKASSTVTSTAISDTSDKIKLSFTSQAKLLKQQGQDPHEIAANLGVTQRQVTEALERAGDSTALLNSLQGAKA